MPLAQQLRNAPPIGLSSKRNEPSIIWLFVRLLGQRAQPTFKYLLFSIGYIFICNILSPGKRHPEYNEGSPESTSLPMHEEPPHCVQDEVFPGIIEKLLHYRLNQSIFC